MSAVIFTARQWADRLFAAKRPDAIAEAVDLRAERLSADQFKRRYAQAIAARCFARSKSAAAAIQQGNRVLTDPNAPSAA